jgi:hypothetical protein
METNQKTSGQPLPFGFVPESGGIPYAIGQPSFLRIPIPNTEGLHIELNPRGFVPKGGSTSTLFIQDTAGKRQLRLDYGYNTRTKTIDYHWNQQSVYNYFEVENHSPAGRYGVITYKAAKYFKHAGRLFVVGGITIDAVSIVQATKPVKRASEVIAGWAGAWAGCKVLGAGGAALGTSIVPVYGTAVGAFGGCIIGGAGGYFAGSAAGSVVYDWAEDTKFQKLFESIRP